MREYVTELKVLDDENNIFDTDLPYEIPLYQRAYAWGDKQLRQLIEDIKDVQKDSNYYIGSLIVSKNENNYEVVDGQQRLTSLFLLLNVIGEKTEKKLTFACRDKSNYTLHNIENFLVKDAGTFDIDRLEQNIHRGIKILQEEINKQIYSDDEKKHLTDDEKMKSFLEKLSKVVLYRIEVPENTDLNRYFEIMNTRGEQLEQHDILKAKLMSYLSNSKDKMKFAEIWNACSDMTGYVQMHFISKNNENRDSIFGSGWDELPDKMFSRIKIEKKEYDDETLKLEYIISDDFKQTEDEGYNEDDVRVRFESVIEFPYFLIHTLKVLIEINKIGHINKSKDIIPRLMDDKKLLTVFEDVIKNGVIEGNRIKDSTEEFSKQFCICLLRTRYLFDKYIVKREYAGDNLDGDWSLKSLYVSGQQSKRKPYYKNTDFASFRAREKTRNEKNKNILMLQSAFRVSYTSPKVMHWITDLLVWLSEKNCKNINESITEFEIYCENLAVEAVRQDFFNQCSNEKYEMGVNTPHIVFNYLDYLLWKNERIDDRDFKFEFRNSVEHWYPQHPSEGTFDSWENGVNRFGNLCIIQRNVNSKFSNLAPEAKKSTFHNMISKGSLKLQIMSNLTAKKGNINASKNWKDELCSNHEEEMIGLLKDACGIGV